MSKEARLLFRAASVRASERSRRRFASARLVAAAFAILFAASLGASASNAATYRTANFIVEARSADLARKIGDAAERCRADLATSWLGRVLPNWYAPCVVKVRAGDDLGAGGETVFTVADGQVFDWKMSIQGSEERLLDSVLPHEITHAIVASYLRKPLPRWIDEGMATSVEASVERTNYRTMLATFLHSKKGIAFNEMVATKEYPADLMPFYSQSFSVCEYLILIGGRRRLVEFAKFGCETGDWSAGLRRYYDCRSLGDLQLEWIDWVARWDSANRPAELPATRKLRDFNELERDEIALANAASAAETPNNPRSGVALASATVPASAANELGRLATDGTGDVARLASNVDRAAVRGQAKPSSDGGLETTSGIAEASARPDVLAQAARGTIANAAVAEDLNAASARPRTAATQTSKSGAKWRAADCLANGAGSASRKTDENRGAASERKSR